MAREQGIRVWRFDSTRGAWRYTPRTGSAHEVYFTPDKVHLPSNRKASPDAFLFERIDPVHADVNHQARIRRRDIIEVVEKRLVPRDSDIFYWKNNNPSAGVQDRDIHRIYVRRGNRDERAERKVKQRAMIKAAMPNETGEFIVMLQSETRVIYFNRNQGMRQQDLHTYEGELPKKFDVGPGLDKGRFLYVLSHQLYKHRSKLEAAFKCAADDPETAAQAFAEVIKGATPSPTQGHNVIHSLNGIIDDCAKLIQVIGGAAIDDASGPTGGFGQGVGAVDGAWQAVGSYLTYISDVCHAMKVWETEKAQRPDLYGDNPKKRAVASAATSALKFASTTFKTTEGIYQIATASSNTVAALAGPAAAAGGIASIVAAARNFHQAYKSGVRLKALQSVNMIRNTELPPGVVMKKDTQQLLDYALSKTRRKMHVKTYEGGVATVGALGAIGTTTAVILIAAGVAAANAWNPVGWGIGIAVFAAGAGMLGYKIYRKYFAKKSIKRSEFPKMLVSRYLHLCVHHRPGGLRSAKTKDRRSMELRVLEGILAAYGVEPYRCCLPQDIPLIEARIARHLKS